MLHLESGVDVDARNNQDYTAMRAAFKLLHENKVLALLEQNAKVFSGDIRDQMFCFSRFNRERSIRIGRLIDASIKLSVAGLSPTTAYPSQKIRAA